MIQELNERSREIFRQIVDVYLETGEPIGDLVDALTARRTDRAIRLVADLEIGRSEGIMMLGAIASNVRKLANFVASLMLSISTVVKSACKCCIRAAIPSKGTASVLLTSPPASIGFPRVQ